MTYADDDEEEDMQTKRLVEIKTAIAMGKLRMTQGFRSAAGYCGADGMVAVEDGGEGGYSSACCCC